MRCCILGGAGFIGTNLATYLAEGGWTVRVCGHKARTRWGRDAIAGGIEFAETEFADAKAVGRAVEGCDVVFHLIGTASPATAELDKLSELRNVLDPTLKLLDHGGSGAFGKIVFVSSGGTVYGRHASAPIVEDQAQWPISSYGVAKLTLERYVRLYGHLSELRYAIARVANPYGRHQVVKNGQGIVARLLECAVCDETFRLVGDGTIVRDYVYVGDVVQALHRLSEYDGEYAVFNIGSGTGVSVNELLMVVQEVSGRQIRVEMQPGRRSDVPFSVLNCDLARRELGWSSRTPIREGIARTLSWLQEVRALEMI